MSAVSVQTEQVGLVDGPYSDGVWMLPGMGESAPTCGEWSPTEFCDESGHVHLTPHRCGRRECPECWSGQWAAPRTVSVTARLAAYRYNAEQAKDKRIVHLTVSPPEGTVRGVDEFYRNRTRANELAKAHGVKGGVVIPHPYRVLDEVKEEFEDSDYEKGLWWYIRENDEPYKEQVYWSPHYHILGPAPDVRESSPDEDEGWIVKNIRSLDRFEGLRDEDGYEDMIGTTRYLLSHAGFVKNQNRQAVTWFGDLHGSQFNPSEELSTGAWSVIERKAEELTGGESDLEDDETGERVCPVDDCEGQLHDMVEGRRFLESRQGQSLDRDARKRVRVAYRWFVGDIHPPPGMKNPSSEEQAQEVMDGFLSGEFGNV